MRHKKLNKRFGRNNAQRKQLMNSLARALFISYKVKTTVDKAKESKKLAEKLITLAKKASLSDIRAINDILQDKALTKKVTKEIAPLFSKRASGYTRIIRCGFRRGDGAPMAILELTDMPVIEKKPKKDKKATKVKPQEKQEAEVGRQEAQPKKVKELPKKKEPKKKEEPKKDKPIPQEPEKEEKPTKEDKKGLFGKFKGFFNKEEE